VIVGLTTAHAHGILMESTGNAFAFTFTFTLLMRLPFAIGFIAALWVAWGFGGIIHSGMRSVNPQAQPPLETVQEVFAGE